MYIPKYNRALSQFKGTRATKKVIKALLVVEYLIVCFNVLV